LIDFEDELNMPDMLALPSSVENGQEVDGVRALGCPFYGKNGMFGTLIDQGGNQCGLILDSYSPCGMEIAGDIPDGRLCALPARARQIAALIPPEETPEITREMIRRFLRKRGWLDLPPGQRYSWKDPVNGFSGYTLLSALENQLTYDAEARRANAGKSLPDSTVQGSATSKGIEK
jgi:hypothetical protein